ncbi:acyl-CoA-binding domain-containing protein 6-like isoform X3 [Salvia divinorum]|uniref:Acyl-CoA-binding domain-containing protein 6-like isoform X3 n=1 Tax=Salvia divinorum TaxID=28513 RepID=A0ABD1GZE0_SALDI
MTCTLLTSRRWYGQESNKKKRPAETLIFDVLKYTWSDAVASLPSSITTNKGFSLVLVQHKERDFLVAFGGTKKDPSNQVEVLTMEKVESSMIRRLTLSKVSGTLLTYNSTIEQHGSGRKSLSESLLVDPNSAPGNVSLRKPFCSEETAEVTTTKISEDKNSFQMMEQATKPFDLCAGNAEETSPIAESDNLGVDKQRSGSLGLEGEELLCQETNCRSRITASSGVCLTPKVKLASLLRKNSILEGQLAAAIAAREAAEKNSSSANKSRQEMERILGDAMKEMELLKEKLASIQLVQEEASSLSNIVHSDNLRLEHDVAFLKAVLDDTQKELYTTREVLAGERASAFQLQVEVFHLKQRLQSLETRAPTPRKPYQM